MSTRPSLAERRKTMIMSIDELCKYLRISRATLYHLRKKGKIPYFTVGRRVLFNKEQIDQWIKEGGTA